MLYSSSLSHSMCLLEQPYLGCCDWSERKDIGSLVGERRKERQSGDLSKHMGVYSDPSHTDVSAAETARKQAATLLLPHLVLFFFRFVLFLFSLSLILLFGLFCWAFILPHSLSLSLSAGLPPNLDDYSKIKGLKRNFEQSQPLMSLLD